LKVVSKIGFSLFLLFCANILYAQEGENLIPLFNKLFLNPSFSGWNENTSVQTGNYFFAEPEDILNHNFYFSYDTYSEKLKGGVGLLIFQGLNGNQNINTAGLGFSYSKALPTSAGKSFIPSFNLNYKLASKQWFLQFMEPLAPPGREMFRYSVVRPGAGVLWDSPNRQIGLSLAYQFHIGISDAGDPPPENFPDLIFYFSKPVGGKQKGLTSKPYRFVPEIVVRYSQNTLLTRAAVRVSTVHHNYGLYIQNNFNSKIHGAGGIFGWNFGRYKLHLAAGSGYHFATEKVTFFGEVSLTLMLPYTYSDQKNPWATPKKLF
jgi:hypothetical protein